MNRRRAKKENEEGKRRFKPSETCPISVNRQEGQREVYEYFQRVNASAYLRTFPNKSKVNEKDYNS